MVAADMELIVFIAVFTDFILEQGAIAAAVVRQDFTLHNLHEPPLFVLQLLAEDHDGVWVYGEIQDAVSLHQTVQAGDRLGHVIQVLRNDKGRPMSMLHLERHVQGSRYSPAWNVGEAQPSHLLDPTERLIHHAFHSSH